jgi:hypothetical protein
MRRLFGQKKKGEDFSTFLGDSSMSTKKSALLEECKKHDISPYIDDATESSSGAYATFRGVASEAELERRLNTKKALGLSNQANAIAFLAFIVSLAALAKSFLWP